MRMTFLFQPVSQVLLAAQDPWALGLPKNLSPQVPIQPAWSNHVLEPPGCPFACDGCQHHRHQLAVRSPQQESLQRRAVIGASPSVLDGVEQDHGVPQVPLDMGPGGCQPS